MIRRHLERGESLTPRDALTLYGCARLAARIHDLRQEGLPIESDTITVQGAYGPATIARYRLPRGQQSLF
jgi:hypothetical protein